jgi:hypothetical protein
MPYTCGDIWRRRRPASTVVRFAAPSRYTGGLDEAKTPEDVYCEFVRRERWLRPYDDDPPAPPAPPPPPAPPLSPAARELLDGTW